MGSSCGISGVRVTDLAGGTERAGMIEIGREGRMARKLGDRRSTDGKLEPGGVPIKSSKTRSFERRSLTSIVWLG